MSFYEILGVAISGTCVGTYNTRNYITSPNYPQMYGNDIDCRWLISSPGVNNLTLEFLDFQTESSSDYLNVYEGQNIHGNLIDTYSGNTLSPIVSNGNNLYLRFTSGSHSDLSFTYRGFKIEIMGKYKYYYELASIIKTFLFLKIQNDIVIHVSNI